MKINLPKGAKPVKSKKSVEKKSDIKWKEIDGYLHAKIRGKIIKISLKSNDIIFSNNFKISANSLEEAKEKAINFFL